MLGVPHSNSKKATARSRTARTARTAGTARTALALGFCTAALILSAGTASASAPAPAAAPSADPGTACQPATGFLPEPVAGEILTLCKLVNGWD